MLNKYVNAISTRNKVIFNMQTYKYCKTEYKYIVNIRLLFGIQVAYNRK
jgi:hypothetical protein